MASEVKADKLSPSSGTTLTLGDASDTVTLPTGVTFNIVDGVPVASGGTGQTSYTAGDILYATGSTTVAKLGKGSALQALQTNSGATAPEWAASPQSVLTAEGDVMYASSANTLARLAKGSATEVLAMNSGATAPEWVTAGAGTTIKRHYFEYSTRVAGAGAGAQFTYTTSFIPTDPTANDLWVQSVAPMKGASGDWYWGGLRFIKSGGSTYNYDFKGIQYVDPNNYQSDVSFNFVIPAGDLPAGTYEVKLTAGDASSGSGSSYWALNTSDNAGVGGQTVCTLMITEFKN
jgi:hypothetical protein